MSDAIGYIVVLRTASGAFTTDTVGIWPTIGEAEEDRFSAEADTGDDYQVMAVVPVTGKEGT